MLLALLEIVDGVAAQGICVGPDGDLVITFTEDHTIRDILRYLLSTGVDAEELIYHINDPELLAKEKK